MTVCGQHLCCYPESKAPAPLGPRDILNIKSAQDLKLADWAKRTAMKGRVNIAYIIISDMPLGSSLT